MLTDHWLSDCLSDCFDRLSCKQYPVAVI